jgi:hypothetical protein
MAWTWDEKGRDLMAFALGVKETMRAGGRAAAQFANKKTQKDSILAITDYCSVSAFTLHV